MTKLAKNRIEKIGVLRQKIKLCKKYKYEIISNVSHLNHLYWKEKIPEWLYKEKLNEYLQGKTLDDWVKNYDDLIETFNNEIKAIGRSQNWLNNSLLLIGFLLFIATLFLMSTKLPIEKQEITGLTIITFNESLINKTIEEITNVTEIIVEEINETINITEEINKTIEIINITQINETNISRPIINESLINDTRELIENLSDEILPKIEEESTLQGEAVIGKPVKWIKNIKLKKKTKDLEIDIPESATDIIINDILENKKIKTEKIKDKIKIKEEIEEIEIEYYTEPPTAIETEINSYTKQIIVSSVIPYTDILASTELPLEAPLNAIKLYWIKEEGRELFEFDAFDKNNDNLIDYIEWIIPHLSNQTFEVEITILNVHSYPTLGGNWTVRFNTTGTANLTITAVNDTYFDEDIEFLELRCNEQIISTQLTDGKIFVEDYSCDETGYETSKELTTGKHYLEFRFGDSVAYAENYVVGSAACRNSAGVEVRPPVKGTDTYWNWSIYQHINCTNTTITLYGNLTILSGGKLSLYNVTLNMSCDVDGGCGINVTSVSDGMFVYDHDPADSIKKGSSWIRSNGTRNYTFTVHAPFEMKDSVLEDAGSSATQGFRGLEIFSSDVVIDNNVFMNNLYGLFLYGNNSNITNNKFNFSANKALYIGISGYATKNSLIKNNIFNNSGDGIVNTDAAIYFYGNSTFVNNTVINSDPIGIFEVGGGKGNWINITNTSISKSTGSDIRVADARWYILNSSVNKSRVQWAGATSRGNITFLWYLRANITNASSKTFPGVNVSIYSNRTGSMALEYNFTTDSDGIIPYIKAYEGVAKRPWNVTKQNDAYGNNRLNISYRYNITAKKKGYRINWTVIDPVNKSQTVILALSDVTPPGWNNSNRTNGTTATPKVNDIFNVSINVTDWGGLDWVRFAHNFTGGDITNGTLKDISGVSYLLHNASQVTLTRGKVIGWVWWVNDTSNNTNTSLVFTTTVRNTPPTLPTLSYPEDGKNYSLVMINYTASADADSDTLTYYRYVNGTLNGSSVNNVSQFNATDGFYNLSVTVTDGYNFSANTSIIHFRLDTTAPAFSGFVKNVSDTSIHRNTGIHFNITITDGADVKNWTFNWNESGSWNNVTNSTDLYVNSVGAIVNHSIQSRKVNYTVGYQFCARDALNNTACDTVRTFSVADTPPLTPTVSMPEDGKNYSLVMINYTSSDDDSDSLTFYRYINGTLNGSSVNNVSQFNATDGFYNLTVTVTDGTVYSANSSVRHFRLDTTGPGFSGAQDNKTGVKVNGAIQFNITITDGAGVSYWIFSWNGTGSWINETNGSLTDTIQSYKISANVSTNLTQGNTIGYYFWANDSLANSASDISATFTISNTAPNTTTIPNQTWSEDSTKTLNITPYFQDLDSDDINWTYNKTGANIDVNLSNSSGEVNFTPGRNWNGVEYIIFTALDGYGGSIASNNITLTVTNTPDCGIDGCEDGETCSSCEVDCGSCGGGDTGPGGGGGGITPGEGEAEAEPEPEPEPEPTPEPEPEPEADTTFSGIDSAASTITSGGSVESGYIRTLINKTNESIEINRTIKVDNETNTTLVNITIVPERVLYNFSYYEMIPKCIALFLKEGLLNESDIEFKNWDFEIIEEDPLIVWRFAEVREPLDLSYTVKKKILEDCAELLEGFGIATDFGPLLEQPKKIISVLKIILPIVAAIVVAFIFIYFARFELRARKGKKKKKSS